MGLLDGKVAIITGASRGIGKEIAKEFIAQGATVAFTYLSSDEKAKALELELSASLTLSQTLVAESKAKVRFPCLCT